MFVIQGRLQYQLLSFLQQICHPTTDVEQLHGTEMTKRYVSSTAVSITIYVAI